MRASATILTLLAAASTHAAPAADVSASRGRPANGSDYAVGVVSAAAGSVLLGAAAGYVGGLVSSAAIDCDDGDDFICLDFVPGLLVGGATGLTVGAGLGVSLAGDARGVRGSDGWAYGGAALGLAAAAATTLACNAGDDPCGELAWASLALPAVGATIGYFAGAPSRGAPRTGALLDYHPAEGVRVGAPALSVDVRPGQETIAATLVGGRF